MRNLKFLFISFFLLLVSMSSTFASGVEIKYKTIDGLTTTVSSDIILTLSNGNSKGIYFYDSNNSGSGIIHISNGGTGSSITMNIDPNINFYYNGQTFLDVYEFYAPTNGMIKYFVLGGGASDTNAFASVESVTSPSRGTLSKSEFKEQNRKVNLLLEALVLNTNNSTDPLAKSINTIARGMFDKTVALSEVMGDKITITLPDFVSNATSSSITNTGTNVSTGINVTTANTNNNTSTGTNTSNTVNPTAPKNYTGLTSLYISKYYIDPSLNVEIEAYTGACNGLISNKTVTSVAEVNTCAKKIATKIISASDAGLNRFMTYNSSELNSRLMASYNIRAKNRKLFSGKLPNLLTGSLVSFNSAKYDYFADTSGLLDIPGIDLIDFTGVNDTNKNIITTNINIERDEVSVAKNFKTKFDELKKDVNINAKLTAIYEISKIDFGGNNLLKDAFYSALLNNIQKTTTSDPKFEQRFITNINSDTVISNKEIRGQKLKSYIKTIRKPDFNSSSKITLLKNNSNGIFFKKENGKWVPNTALNTTNN